MPAPSNPPPQNEEGAILSPRQLLRWLDVNPVHPLTRTQTYLTLPAFNRFNEWFGYSMLVGAFNFTATRNFTLPTNYTVPVNPDYVLCVAWIDSNNNMHRYKLWEDVGEVFYFDVPLYTGQLIKKNFRFEIWNTFNGELIDVTIAGAGEVNSNQTYPFFGLVSGILQWVGVQREISGVSPANEGFILFNTLNSDIYYTVQGSVFGIWEIVTGAAPAPYATMSTACFQLTNLTFYTSVRGNFDYMWRDDNALATASALITDFNIANINAPWTAPDNSIPTINT